MNINTYIFVFIISFYSCTEKELNTDKMNKSEVLSFINNKNTIHSYSRKDIPNYVSNYLDSINNESFFIKDYSDLAIEDLVEPTYKFLTHLYLNDTLCLIIYDELGNWTVTTTQMEFFHKRNKEIRYKKLHTSEIPELSIYVKNPEINLK